MSPISSLFNFLKIFAAHLIWAWDFILHQSFFGFSKFDFPAAAAEAATESFARETGLIRLHKHSGGGHEGGGGENECSICLFKMEEGHEIRELNCGHDFHRVCLDRWVSHGQITCPLCRRYLWLPLTTITGQFPQEVVLLFKFCDFGSSHRGSESWWLR